MPNVPKGMKNDPIYSYFFYSTIYYSIILIVNNASYFCSIRGLVLAVIEYAVTVYTFL